MDGVHLRVQRNHYYDFTVHFMNVIERNMFKEPKIGFKKLVEGTVFLKARNRRAVLNDSLIQLYKICFDPFMVRFTMEQTSKLNRTLAQCISKIR